MEKLGTVMLNGTPVPFDEPDAPDEGWRLGQSFTHRARRLGVRDLEVDAERAAHRALPLRRCLERPEVAPRRCARLALRGLPVWRKHAPTSVFPGNPRALLVARQLPIARPS